jgi:hypothetical protein
MAVLCPWLLFVVFLFLRLLRIGLVAVGLGLLSLWIQLFGRLMRSGFVEGLRRGL